VAAPGAGQQFRVRGFEICSGCGKVLSGPPAAKQHACSCRYRDTPDNAKARKLLFMYREFQSEALQRSERSLQRRRPLTHGFKDRELEIGIYRSVF
jgi:hypothetical protein